MAAEAKAEAVWRGSFLSSAEGQWHTLFAEVERVLREHPVQVKHGAYRGTAIERATPVWSLETTLKMVLKLAPYAAPLGVAMLSKCLATNLKKYGFDTPSLFVAKTPALKLLWDLDSLASMWSNKVAGLRSLQDQIKFSKESIPRFATNAFMAAAFASKEEVAKARQMVDRLQSNINLFTAGLETDKKSLHNLGLAILAIQQCWIVNFLAAHLAPWDETNIQNEVMARAPYPNLDEDEYQAMLAEQKQAQAKASASASASLQLPVFYAMAGIGSDVKHAFGRPVVPLDQTATAATATAAAPSKKAGDAKRPAMPEWHPPSDHGYCGHPG
jgi:hypothetical protein